jgi:hypothetical protein
MALSMEIIDALWLVVTLTEGGKHPQKFFIPAFITLNSSSYNLLKKENSWSFVIFMAIAEGKIYSCMAVTMNKTQRKQGYILT